jgi:hypothetical protein
MEVLDCTLEILDFVATNWEYIKLTEIVKTFKDSDLVAKERQISQLCKLVQAFDLLNEVEWQVKPLQVN